MLVFCRGRKGRNEKPEGVDERGGQRFSVGVDKVGTGYCVAMVRGAHG